MLRTIGVLKATVLTAALAAGCYEQREASAPTQPPPSYAGQPGYQGQPGYPPPGYQQPGYPPPGYTPPQQPAPQQPAPQQPAPQQPAPQETTTPGGFPWPFPFPGQPQQPAPQQPAPQQPAPQQPAPQQPAPSGTSAGSATPIDPALASAATIPLNAYAANEAKGMAAEGPPIAGQFREGQTLEHAFQLLPGKCYTILGVGAGITELDISLIALTPIPMGSPVLAQDNSSGANASLGGRGNCYRWSLPVGINAKFVVKATAGSGVAAAQLYVK